MIIWAILLSLIGLGFVVAEVFFPSLGVLGLIAAACVISADVMAFREGQAVGWSFVVAQVILIPWAVTSALKWLPKTGFGSRMMLSGPKTESGPGAPDFDHLVGQVGITSTDLRPSGTARFGDERISVVSLTGMLDAGIPIVVVSVEGTEVRVRPAPEESTSASS